jgi:hypothetical protein
LDDSSIRGELRQRLVREGMVRPQYDVERGLARLRAAIANVPSGSEAEPASEPPSARLSVSNYAVKGSVWKVAGVVGLASTTAIVGLRAWGPARHVVRADAIGAAPPAADHAALARAEADNFARIQTALPRDPAAALSLVEEGNVLYAAGGTLGEEREASAVDALVALGLRTEAESRARRFLQEHPKSPLAERVRRSAKL